MRSIRGSMRSTLPFICAPSLETPLLLGGSWDMLSTDNWAHDLITSLTGPSDVIPIMQKIFL